MPPDHKEQHMKHYYFKVLSIWFCMFNFNDLTTQTIHTATTTITSTTVVVPVVLYLQ